MEPHKSRLAELGVKRLLLVGSISRNQAGLDSDADFVVEFEGPATFLAYMDLMDLLQQATGRSVDLTTVNALRPEIAAEVLAEALQVA